MVVIFVSSHGVFIAKTAAISILAAATNGGISIAGKENDRGASDGRIQLSILTSLEGSKRRSF
jgi:hypothetical protein